MTAARLKAHFRIHGLRLEIRSDHRALLNAMEADLRPFRVNGRAPARGGVRIRLAALPGPLEANHYPRPFAEYRVIGQRRRLPGGATVEQFAPCAVTVVSSLHSRTIRAAVLPEWARAADPAYHYCFTQPVGPWLKRRGLFFLHAGCVARGPEGILFVGPSSAGKSVLSLCAVRAGFKLLSDEQPLLRLQAGRVEALPFPRRIRLDPPAARLFPELRELRQSRKAARLVFPIERFWPGSIGSPCRPRILLFPEFQNHGRLRLSPLSPTRALSRLLQDDHFIWYKGGPWTKVSHGHFALFGRLVRQAKAFHLKYSNRHLRAIPALLHRLLTDGQPC